MTDKEYGIEKWTFRYLIVPNLIRRFTQVNPKFEENHGKTEIIRSPGAIVFEPRTPLPISSEISETLGHWWGKYFKLNTV